MSSSGFANLRGLRLAAVLSLLTAAVGCGVEKQAAPALLGPSEFSLSITMTATPDTLPRDGRSQSVIVLTARDAQGRTVAGQRVSLSTSLPVTLSQSEVVTGNDGRATFSVTAPAAGSVGNEIVIFATPIGSNSENAIPRSVTVLISGASNSTAPVPDFTVTPANPEQGAVVTFDASTTTDEGGPCGDKCTYSWDFGGDGTATGRVVTHVFQNARSYSVVLTVRDAAGTTATRRQTVIVSAAAAPTVSFTVSPPSPVVNQQTTFTAAATPAPNHSIVRYVWNFGDGTSATTPGPSVTKIYTAAGPYVVTVNAVDDLNQSGAASATVTVVSGITAAFTMSPSNPRVGDTVSFNASNSTTSNGATIVEYTWDFGDNSPTVTSATPTTTHQFTQARSFIIRLTVRDSQNRTSTLTQSLQVATP
ncbi:MAG TPA: PKD domain-containing protein [Vicinamibacterales bacterium]|jgi:PKD repeat protein|nr:PKD domain-containing protein [Vicinamibacterales bacterium]